MATPLHTGAMHYAYVSGALQAMATFAGRISCDVYMGSVLSKNRDVLTARFLDSKATHMLCIDSDIGWLPEHAQKLLDANVDFVSGVYAKKQPDRAIPAHVTGEVKGELAAALHVPAGFLLLSRACVERMVGAYRHLEYEMPTGKAWGLWSPTFILGSGQNGEDVAFCNRWLEIGGKIWLHTGVVLAHIGEHIFMPKD